MTGTIVSHSISGGISLTSSNYNPVLITMAGTINSPGAYGISAANGVAWTITNYGLVTATAAGAVGIDFGADTVGVTLTNAGTIGGTGAGDAVLFGSGDDLLVVDPGAVFAGTIDGGAGTNTLQLTSAASNGTLTGLSTTYVNFQSVTVDAGAYWNFSDNDIVGAGVVLTNAGTINMPGVASLYLAGGGLTNQATGVISGNAIYALPGSIGSIDNSGLISNTYGVRLGDTSTVTNLGTILANASAPPGYGVYGKHGGTVANGVAGVSTASIQGYNGIRFVNGVGSSYYGSVTNFGTIAGTGAESTGINLDQGGTVTNGDGTTTAALVQGGRYGVFVASGTVTNYGTINAIYDGSSADGVSIPEGTAYVFNLGSNALIQGYYGISVSYGTITNAGTIASTQGAGGIAVKFAAGSNRVVVEPGAKFIGIVQGNSNPLNSSALELAGTAAATLTGLGTSFVNFGTVALDAGSDWSLAGASTVAAGSTFDVAGSLGVAGLVNNAAGFIVDGGTINLASYSDASAGSTFDFVAVALSEPTLILGAAGGGNTIADTISGFASSDTIDLPALGFLTGATAIVSGTTLEVVSNDATVDLAVAGLTNGMSYFTEQDGGIGTEIVACFATGTRIATPSGEVAVEKLCVGDTVSTYGGNAVAIRWIGWRSHSAAVVAANPQLRPVRIRAHALAPGVPARDLVVSPSHALLVDDALIPAGALVNGVSIVRDAATGVAYFHVELDRHDILLAEGAPAESFFDVVGRSIFENAADYIAPFDDAVPKSCLARIEEGIIVQVVRHRLAARAGISRAAAPPGQLHGHVERILASDDGLACTVEGWVLDEADPNESVELDVITEAGPRLRVPANRYRVDLDRAGLAGGRCGFSVRLPGRGRVVVQRAVDGAELPIAA